MATNVLNTTINFGMVSAPCRLQKASSKAAPGFVMCSPAGNPVKQHYVDLETGELFLPAECGKAAVADDKTLFPVDKDTVAAIDASCKIDGLTIDGFIALDTVPFERSDNCYFLAPPNGAVPSQVQPLAILAASLKATGKAGHGKLTVRSIQRAFVVYEKDGALILNTLAFADDFRAPAEAAAPFADFDLSDKLLGLGVTLIDALTPEDGKRLDDYTDDAKPKKAALIEAVLAGEKIVAPAAAKPVEAADNLEALLLASLADAPAAAPKKAAKKAAAKAAA